MASAKWNKIENESGYPCFIDETTGNEQYDHPKFQAILLTLEEYDDIKYSAYRTAFKIFALQRQLRVPPLRIASGVFARHQLSLSESSLSLDTAELEAVLADIYFAAEKEGLFSGDVDLTVDLLINLLLNVFDRDRKQPIRVLAAKTLLITLSEESVSDKWSALANCCADHNGCVSPKRLTALLTHLTALPEYLGAKVDQIQADVDTCFDKSAGMLGISARAVAEWGVTQCHSLRWLSVVQRVIDSRTIARATSSCKACHQPLIQVLKFKCVKCNDVYFCEKCYLYDKDLGKVGGHKKTHLIQEIIEGEAHSSQCLSFINNVKRLFFCSKNKEKKSKTKPKKSMEKENQPPERRKKGIATSTVGKASGHTATNPASMLQDIIAQLESQNRLLKDLMAQLEKGENNDDGFKAKVEAHHTQISTQISRLKVVKENLGLDPQGLSGETKTCGGDRPQAFDFFSPIPVEEKQSKVTDDLKTQPRVLSLDSGNFSVMSKQVDPITLVEPITLSEVKPVHATTDSISTVSMNDISQWYNDCETPAQLNHQPPQPLQSGIERTRMSQSLSMTEQRFAADIRSVKTGNDKIKDSNADLNSVLDRLQQILTNNFAMDDSCFDNTQLRETANEMEGLLGSLIRGVEQRATINHNKGLQVI